MRKPHNDANISHFRGVRLRYKGEETPVKVPVGESQDRVTVYF